jgi:hypothetical protein
MKHAVLKTNPFGEAFASKPASRINLSEGSKTMRNWICAIALTLSVGCASANFRPYIGEQQSWPIATGSIVNMKYDYPVFTSLPCSPYAVLGELRIESPFYQYPEEGHLPLLIKKAKKLNADAIVLVDGDIFFSTNYGPRPSDAAAAGGGIPTLTQVNRFNPDTFKPTVNLLAIRWIGEPPPGLPVAMKPEAPAPAEQPKEEMAKPAEEAPATNAAPAEVVTPPAALPAEETNQPPAATEQPAPTPPPAVEEPAPAPPAEQPPANQ